MDTTEWDILSQELQERELRAYFKLQIKNFSDRCHLYSLTPEGAARSQLLRDREYDQLKQEWEIRHEQ